MDASDAQGLIGTLADLLPLMVVALLVVLWRHAVGRARAAESELSQTRDRLDQEAERVRRARDDLEAERAERSRLEESQRSLQTAVETLRLGVTVTDMQNRIQYVNPAEAEMHGYERDTLLDQNARIYGYGPDSELDPEPPPARFWDRDSVNVRRDGTRFPVRLISDVVRGTSGEPIGMLTICEDLSERRAAERIKEDFLASVSHELRTPLTSIVAALDLLDRESFSADPQRSSEMTEIALRNSRRLLRLVDDLLVLQKLRAGRIDFRMEPVAIGPLLDSALSDFQPQARARSIRLVLDHVEPGLRVLADRDRLHQVLSNLLSNALKYSPVGRESRVELSVVPSGGRVTIAVADQGPGIPEESLDQLFEPFHRVKSRSHEEGTGLGLSIVKRLMQGMNGTVTVDSRVDQGTTLRIILPTA